ncbi:MAG: hypothetical protein GC159_06860 [Phycisphaera sp.]|nr:hypothetical protein [Phycisphaera sp.]
MRVIIGTAIGVTLGIVLVAAIFRPWRDRAVEGPVTSTVSPPVDVVSATPPTEPTPAAPAAKPTAAQPSTEPTPVTAVPRVPATPRASIIHGYPPNSDQDPLVRALADLERQLKDAASAGDPDPETLRTTVARLLQLSDYAQRLYDVHSGFPPHMARVASDARLLADEYMPGVSKQPRKPLSEMPDWLRAYGVSVKPAVPTS